MRRLFIVNPAARNAPRDLEARIRARFPEAEIIETSGPGDAGRLAAKALERGWGRGDLLAACGGDGTFREVAEAAGSAATLGILPLGTVNQIAALLRIPKSLGGALETLARGETREIYPGLCRFDGAPRPQPFLIGVSAGPDADAVHLVGPACKRRFGPYAYLASFLRRLGAPVRPEVTVTAGGAPFRASQAIALRSPLYGGRFRLSRDLDHGRPGLELLCAEGGRLAVLGLTLGGFLRMPPAPAVRLGPGETALLILPAPGRFQIDGDAVTAARAECAASAEPLRVVAGPPQAARGLA